MKLDIKKFEGSRLHVVDVSAVATTKWFHFKDLTWKVEGEVVNTGALYAIFSLFIQIPLTDVVAFCFDSAYNKRKEANPDYKAGRQKVHTDDYFQQIHVLREILNNCKFPIFVHHGYEGDDFVVGAVESYKEDFDHVFVYSNDHDSLALVDENVYYKSAVTKRPDVTKENYEEVAKCPYNTINVYKATVGCKSDNIKGVKGFGDAAFKKLAQWMVDNYNTSEIKDKGLERDVIENYPNFKEEQRDQALSALEDVMPMLPPKYHFEPLVNEVNVNLLKWNLERYGMNSVLKKL